MCVLLLLAWSGGLRSSSSFLFFLGPAQIDWPWGSGQASSTRVASETDEVIKRLDRGAAHFYNMAIYNKHTAAGGRVYFALRVHQAPISVVNLHLQTSNDEIGCPNGENSQVRTRIFLSPRSTEKKYVNSVQRHC